MIFGYTDEEVLGRSLDRLMPEDERRLHDAGMRQYLATGRRKLRWEGVELPGLTKDSRIVPLEISFGEFNRFRHMRRSRLSGRQYVNT
jgi:PAS domain S-box-containing protein